MASVRSVLTVLALVAVLASHPTAAPTYSAWSTPENLGPAINSGALESGPAVSKDGLSLFFHSTREGGFGGNDIWVSQRSSLVEPWGVPRNLGAVVNGAGTDNVPALSRDEHWLFFHSSRNGGFGSFDLWASYRPHTQDDFAWEAPVNLGPVINTAGAEAGAGFFENDGFPLLFFASTRAGGVGGLDIYVSQIFDGHFGTPSPLTELNTGASDQRPSVRADGLEMVLTSDRAGSYGGLDLWVAIRETTSQVWSAPLNLGATVNSSSTDQQAYISSDREMVFFASDRPGGSGGLDLYVTTRTKVHD